MRTAGCRSRDTRSKAIRKGISLTAAISCVREPAGFTDRTEGSQPQGASSDIDQKSFDPAGSEELVRRGNVRWTRKQALAVAAQRLEWKLGNALCDPISGFPVYRRDDPVPGRRGRRRGRNLVLLQGSARLFAASGLRAAGDDARACGRRRAARRVFQGAAS